MDFYMYTVQLKQYLDAQDQRIAQLESIVDALQKQLQQIETRPQVRVDRIEYKFDQLKVETLEGTLNIGLNPSDLDSIEDLALNQAAQGGSLVPYQFNGRDNFIKDIRNHILSDLDSIIAGAEEQLRQGLDPSLQQMLKGDIETQLEARISRYLDQTPAADRSPHLLEQVKEKICEQIKNEIIQAVRNFILTAPHPTGGNL